MGFGVHGAEASKRGRGLQRYVAIVHGSGAAAFVLFHLLELSPVAGLAKVAVQSWPLVNLSMEVRSDCNVAHHWE
jgi:hypothetical protein